MGFGLLLDAPLLRLLLFLVLLATIQSIFLIRTHTEIIISLHLLILLDVIIIEYVLFIVILDYIRG